MNIKKLLTLIFIMSIAGILYGYSADEVNGDIDEGSQPQMFRMVELPASFNVDVATAELNEARMNGNMERVKELSYQLHTWWKLNGDFSLKPMEQGSNPYPGPSYREESYHPGSGSSPLWGGDVRIDPNDNVKPARIASLSNGDLYTISVWYDGSAYHGLIKRSTNNGATWTTYWDAAFATTTTILYPGIIVDNDTLVYWYILDHPASSEMRTWVKVCLPGTSDDPIYWGSPTGGFNPIDYSDLFLTTDAPIYGTGEYLYATWTEANISGTDSTWVMYAVSWENNVSSWEVGPTQLAYSAGNNIYWRGTRIAYGSSSDALWLVAWLHPNLYPSTYDRAIWGAFSTNYGSTWSTWSNITPYTGGTDEFDPSIAGSHINTNWVILGTQVDTNFANDQDVYNWYSTDDGANWTQGLWVTNSYENYLPDVWVDNGSNGFFGILRQDRLSAGTEFVRYKAGDINDPNSWSGSVGINDDPNEDLSNVYGPSAGYNEGTGEAVIAWNNYEGYVYSIWFDRENATGISEEGIESDFQKGLNLKATSLSKNAIQIEFSLPMKGNVSLKAYDVTGRLVGTVLNGVYDKGSHTHTWNANLSTGQYFLRLETEKGASTKSVIILR